MKRFLLLLSLLLLLTGCSADAPEDATEESTESQSVSLYTPGSALEQQTGGAIQLYSPEDEYSSVWFMGQKMLLGSKNGQLTLLMGSQANVTASYDLGILIQQAALHVTQTGLAYYRKSDNCIITCNTMLQEMGTFPLPGGISGIPAVSLANKEIYYCIGQEVQALDMSTGITRLVKQYTNGKPSLTGSLFDCSVLVCELSAEETETHYISTKTGQTLNRNPGITDIQTNSTNYLLHRTDGGVPQIAFGNLDSQAKSLNIIQDGLTVRGVPELNGAVSWQESENGLILSYYDLSTGKRSASVTLGGVAVPTAIASDGKYIWLLTRENAREVLLKWDVSLSPTQDETVYTGTLFTASNPDTNGLAQCNKQADSLYKTYGLRFRFWKDALKVTGGYTFQPEYQIPSINAFLNDISKALSQYPSNFLKKTLRSGNIYLGFVREIAGGKDYVLYHNDGNAYIVFALGTDVNQALCHAAGYLVDSFVLGNSRDYDDWNLLNPSDFVYGEPCSDVYLTDTGRYFIDEQATLSPRDDRQRIFAYAMQADKANYFSTDAMQAKLRLVCSGIREAYGVEKKQQAYPWEQHLTKPMFTK